MSGDPTEVAVYADGQASHSARMLLDRAHSRLYILDRVGERLRTLDVATLRVVGETAAGGKPMRLALSADGTRALLTRDDGTLRIVDTSSGRILGDVPVGASAYGVAVTGSGRYAYVTDPSDDGIALVDTASGTDPTYALVAVADPVTHAIRFYDGEGVRQFDALLVIRPASLAFAPDRSNLVVGFDLGGTPGLAVLDFGTNTTRIVALHPPADALPIEETPAVDSDGAFAYLVAGRALYIVDTQPGASFGTRRVVRLGSQGVAVAVGPGAVAYVLTDDMRVSVIDSD